MISQSRTSRVLVYALVLSHLVYLETAFGMKATSEFGSNVREFFTSNPDGRFLVKIQLWGDVGLSGTHYVPDNTTLLDLIGYAGGPQGGNFSTAKITIRRITGDKNQIFSTPSLLEVQGKQLLEFGTMEKWKLKNGDIVNVETEKPSTSFLSTLGVVATITGTVTALITLYLLTKSLK